MKASIVSLTCCAGCVSSLLNAGERLTDILLGELDVIYSPTFIDLREVPKVEVAIVEGGVRTERDEEIIREVRAKSNVLVALGLCATHGGITSLGNLASARRLIAKAYSMIDQKRLPELKELMYPIDHFVDVDYYVWGCPPMPHLIVHTLKNILTGKKPERHQSVVCTECHRKIVAAKTKRLYGIYEKEADPATCLVSQGFICLGALTRDGCGAPCPRAGFTCFGCRGPPDAFMYRSRDIYGLLVKVVSRRTGISEERISKELTRNPFIFHTFIFSKLARFQSRERII
ncbi:MAG: F420-nonreducing hydrogenase [Candidatus Bathyarchaeota archaeon]|nr:F420-nonreducing hydrogenase [Candidatus Bathyarchaeota archaeon]